MFFSAIKKVLGRFISAIRKKSCDMPKKLITVKELAEILSIKPKTIYTWAELGLIPCYKLLGCLRFDPDEIEAWKNTWRRGGGEGYNPVAQTLISPRERR